MNIWSVWFESNNKVTLQASGLTKEQAETLAKSEAALQIDELKGKYVVKAEIVIRQQRYALPEGFTIRTPLPSGENVYDETGRACSLFYGGYTSKDDRPYLMTCAQSGGRSIPLQKVQR